MQTEEILADLTERFPDHFFKIERGVLHIDGVSAGLKWSSDSAPVLSENMQQSADKELLSMIVGYTVDELRRRGHEII
jgi:hypothetical protein